MKVNQNQGTSRTQTVLSYCRPVCHQVATGHSHQSHQISTRQGHLEELIPLQQLAQDRHQTKFSPTSQVCQSNSHQWSSQAFPIPMIT